MISNTSSDTPASSSGEILDSEKQDQNLLKVEAAQVYVQMKKNTRVSRNIRACWFFKHLRQKVKFTPPTSVENLIEDLTLVSVIPKDPEVKLSQNQAYEVFIEPETNVTFLSSQYRLSFTLDLSPSLMSVDVHNGQYIYDGILKSLSRCLRGLVAPVPIPGTDVSYSPDLYISVICHTPVVCSSTNQVLVQGVKINQSNIDYYLHHIEFELNQFEAALSDSFAKLLKLYRRTWQQESLIARPDGEEDTGEEFNPTDHMGTPEAGFTNMLRYGILALQLLPDNSSSGIIVITDGIVGLPSSFEIERLLNQLRNHTIMCSFIKVGSSSGLYRKLCHVPHIELMQAIATATFGAYLGSAPDVTEELDDVNLYHRAMLFWSFQRGLEGFKYELTHYSDEDMPGSISWIKKMLHRHPITLESFGIENLRKEREKRVVRAGLHNVLAVRLREGYTLKSINISQDHREIHVKMHFPWRDYGKIEYTAMANWPLEKDNLVTNIEVAVEGSYDLLHDMLCKPTDIYERSPFRLSNVKTLWNILDRISSTDRILEKLQSFSSQPTYFLTPEKIRSGVPLFYMQQEGPSLNMQLQGSEIDQFASFWKDVIQLKTSTWQKWLHSHRIGLVLEHDRQFPKYFQVPNASSRFTSIQCRQAMASLSLLLREWSTFVLAENHSYIKFLHIDQDKPPQFFCVLRLTSKAPNMIIRLGFLGGTPACIRLAEIEVLREKIRNLSFPHRGTQKVSSRIPHSTSADSIEEAKRHKSPLSREGSEIACCVLLTKPVEKILVIYESRPYDMMILKESVHFSSSGVSHPPQDPMRSTFRTITHYLQHQRWIWTIQASKKVPVSMSSVSRLLSTITKLRLQEGFNVAVSSAGITNLVLEVDMKEHENSSDGEDPPMHTCVVQYIVFPPHTKIIDDSVSEEDQGDTGVLTEADAEVQIVTECWLEPQYGVCCNNTAERQHFNGLNYMDIAKAFYPFDYECVSSLSTFEHLVYLCENNTQPSPDLLPSLQPSPPSTPGQRLREKKPEETSFRSKSTVNLVPFPFDLQSLLPRSQQAKLLFSTFVIGDANTVSEDLLDPKGPNELLLSLFYDKLKENHSNEILLSAEDCSRFLQQVSNRSQSKDSNAGLVKHFHDTGSNATSLDKSPYGAAGKRSTPDSHHSSPNQTAKQTDRNPKPNRESPQNMENVSKYFHSKYTSQQTSKPGSASTNGSLDNDSGQENGEEDPSQEPSSGHSPMWKCYIKREGSDHLLMTFVPSTFEDLLLLNPAPDPEPVPDNLDLLGHDGAEPHVTAESLFGTSVEAEIFIRELPPILPCLAEKDKVKNDKRNQTPEGIENPSDDETRDRENKNEEVQDWVNSSSRCMKPAFSGELQMPVYTYSCQLKHVTNSLIERWTFKLPEDVVHDFTYKSNVCSGGNPSLRERCFGKESGLLKQEDQQSRGGSSDRRSTDSTSIAIEVFKEHCLMLADLYSKAFVTGVFQSLQQSYYLDSRDVFAAINDICDRSYPLETDMTTHLLASCCHMQNLVHRARRLEKKAEEASGGRRTSADSVNDFGGDVDSSRGGAIFTRQVSVRFQEIDLQKEDEAPKIPEVLQLPDQILELSPEEWSHLSPMDCHQAKDQKQLLETVRAKFQEAFGLCLKQVPSLPDFYFYCPNIGQIDSASDIDDKELAAAYDGNRDLIGDTREEEEKAKVEEENEPSLRDASMESNREVSSLDSLEGNSSTDLEEGCDLLPLFVHFTCTIKQKSSAQQTSVRKVPLCLGDLAQSIKEPLRSVDFGDFKVTFDINCLTLPSEPFHRFSFQSFLSNCSQSSTEIEDSGEEPGHMANSTPKPIGNPISHLPKLQSSAIYGFKEEIESLMQEEVISALRHMFPISADTLSFVADYIHNGVDYQIKTARYQIVNMQFVFDTDQSLNMFIQEFERMSLPGYKLTREGDYYFLIINKTQPLNYPEECNQSEGRENQKETELSYLQQYNQQFDAESIMGKEERSSSLPCIFPSTDPDKQGMVPIVGCPPCAPSGQSQRPRSSSDGKFLSRPLSAGLSETEHRTARSSGGDGRSKPHEIGKLLSELSVDQSLKKSSSFTGLQRPQVRSPVTNGARSRHCSAPSGHAGGNLGGHSRQSTLPQSPSVISSRNSTNDDGFDGDISDNEQDESGSVSDISTIYPELPDFWLLMQIHRDRTEVFFHSRELTDNGLEVNGQHHSLYCLATDNIHKVCRKVNQALLLKELNKTKSCLSLLVPEADQDFAWPRKKNDSDGSEEDEWENDMQGNLVAFMGAMPAGFFACPVVWQHKFFLHPRLHISKVGGEPAGLLVIRNALRTFDVQNRNNMFVVEDLSSGNVFYLRLKRTQVFQEQVELDLEASLSDSNQFTKQFSQTSKGESDTVSLSSSIGRQSGRTEEVVELTVHGIADVGTDIKEDLMQLLQKKLDDALLDAICVMLSRNPLCKLKRDDVSFIQKPQSEPMQSLLLTIPGHFSSYLMALMYYLQQNLLQFLHTPNYVDSNPAFHFQDYHCGVQSAIPSDKVYLYVRPQEGGGKGIACISVSLVDGRGEEVKLLGCPLPVKNTNCSMRSQDEFEKFVETTRHERSTSDFRPGPTALVQFRIWGCGQLDFKNLCGRLEASVRHTLCDIVMEYFMLTVPVCSVPRNLCDTYGAPMSSLPASPTKMPSDSHEKRPSTLVRKLSAEPGNRSAHGMSSIFSSFVDMRQVSSAALTSEATGAAGKFLDFNTAPGHQSDALSLPRTPMSAHSTGTGSGTGNRLSRQSRPGETHSTPSPDARSLQSIIAMYEAGDKGTLHPDLSSLMEPWMSYCHKTGVPSVVKTTLNFQSKFSIDFVMKELQSSITSICSEVTLKTFKMIPSMVPGQLPQGVPFIPCKSSIADVHLSRRLAGLTAGGGKIGLLGIGRNMYQWQCTVQEHQEATPCFPSSVLRACRGSQKHLPQVPEMEGKVQEAKKHGTSEKIFIPRQKFLLILCTDKQMTLMMYNWSSDLVISVEKTATRLVQWHNARSHVLDSIIAQKMGLYHHFTFSDLQFTPTQNPFTQSSSEVDYLIKYHTPPRDYQRRSSSLSVKERERNYQYPMKRIVPFDQTYKNLPQAKPLDRLMCNICHDPVSRHGHQTQDLRLLSKQDKQQQSSLAQQHHQQTRKDATDEKIPVTKIMDPAFQQGMHLNEVKRLISQEEERNKLYHLYIGWFRTNWKSDANQPILEDYLVQLKRAGRLFHYCATPLIFSASWRQAVVQKTTGRINKTAGGERPPADFKNSNPLLSSNHVAGHGNLASGGGAGPSVSNVTTPATPDRTQKMRSRHSSGASNISAKARQEELSGLGGRKGSGQLDPLSGAGKGRGSKSWETNGEDQGEEPEEAWHLELRQCFMDEYQQYLISELGFIKVNVDPSGPKRGHSPYTASASKVGPVNLQKLLTGGIIVMELSFRQEFFCVKMFAVDWSQLQVIVNQQMHLIFVDECDKYKDLIHVHSFAHDFHLRCVQQYLRNPDASSIFPSGFDLDSFLSDFRQIFPYPPSFSRNCLQQDCVTLPELPFPGHMLYDYMLRQMGVQEMNVVRMVCHRHRNTKETGDKFALVKHSSFHLPARAKDHRDFHSSRSPRDSEANLDSGSLESYDAGLVIINNSGRAEGSGAVEDSMKLVLKYFTVLTRQRDCYPIRTLHRALGEFGGKRPLGQAASVGSSGLAMGDPCKPVAVKQHIGLRKEHVNYRGYSNIHQRLMYTALITQSEKGKEKILEMVKISEKKCRRDYLWQRLIISRNDTEEGNKRRSETSDSSESMLTPLSSLEFCELLESVAVSPLNEIDPQLTPLFNMPISWHQGLFSVLMTKYPEAYRCFQSPDRMTQYILVWNSNNLDMFAMLSLNKTEAKTELSAVMKEPVAADSMHSPSQPNLPLYSLQTHVEDFVNVCCYHVWSSMLH